MPGVVIIPEDTYLILCGGLYFTEDGELSSLRRNAAEFCEEEINDKTIEAAEHGLNVEVVRVYEENIERAQFKE